MLFGQFLPRLDHVNFSKLSLPMAASCSHAFAYVMISLPGGQAFPRRFYS